MPASTGARLTGTSRARGGYRLGRAPGNVAGAAPPDGKMQPTNLPAPDGWHNGSQITCIPTTS
eukprot:6208301-Lingulodinium_polyedra.AAC.1